MIERRGVDRAGLAVFLDDGGLGHELAKRADRGPRLVGGDSLQHLADREEEDDQRRLLGRADDQRAGGGDRHQHLDGEGHAGAGGRIGLARHGHDADHAGRDERPVRGGGPDQAGGPGRTEQRARRQHETALIGLVPGHAVRCRLMDMARQAVPGVDGLFADRVGRPLPGGVSIMVMRMAMNRMIMPGMIFMLATITGCGARRLRLRRNHGGGEAEAGDALLDCVALRLGLVERERQGFRHYRELDVADARQALERTTNGRSAAWTIHAADLPAQGLRAALDPGRGRRVRRLMGMAAAARGCRLRDRRRLRHQHRQDVTEACDALLDRFALGLALVERKRQRFRHDRELDVADSGQALHGAVDRRRAARTIHPADLPAQVLELGVRGRCHSRLRLQAL